MKQHRLPALAFGLLLLLASPPAFAYVGPGSGLMALTMLIAVITAVVVAFVGFLWFPVKRLLRKRRAAAGTAQESGGER